MKMAVSDDCERVYLSNKMLMRVDVLMREDSSYTLFRRIEEDFPLSDIALHPDADVFTVARHTNDSSAVYRYDMCAEEYQLDKVIVGEFDHYSVQMSNLQIAVGDLEGKVAIYDYSYLTKQECSDFGLKDVSISEVGQVEEGIRSIIDMEVSGDLVAAASRYYGLLLFHLSEVGVQPAITFNDSIFISSVSALESVNMVVGGTYNNSVLVYTHNGSEYKLTNTIQMDSQVTAVDLSENYRLLVGTMNG